MYNTVQTLVCVDYRVENLKDHESGRIGGEVAARLRRVGHLRLLREPRRLGRETLLELHLRAALAQPHAPIAQRRTQPVVRITQPPIMIQSESKSRDRGIDKTPDLSNWESIV